MKMQKDDWTDRIKEMIGRAGPVKIMIIIISGVLLIVLSCGNLFDNKNSDEKDTAVSRNTGQESNDLQVYKNTMEEQVESILEKVDGVDDVDVMITLKASKEKVTLKDNTVKTDQSEEETVLVQDENDSTSPYVVQEMEPEIEGILVVCAGGDSPAVQREIIDGISALFPVESHKIKVMKSKEAK